MHNIKNIIIASITVVAASVSVSIFAAASSMEAQCADYLKNYAPDKMPANATPALTYCANHYSCANGLGDQISDCAAKLGKWQAAQAIQASTTAPAKTETQSSAATSPSSATPTPAPTTAPAPAPTPAPIQVPVAAIPATPDVPTTTTTTDTNQTNTKKTDKPSINWF